MIGPAFWVYLFLGLIFGLLAGMAAFVITYDEYSRHRLPQGNLIKISLEISVMSFLVILAISLGVGYFFIGQNG